MTKLATDQDGPTDGDDERGVEKSLECRKSLTAHWGNPDRSWAPATAARVPTTREAIFMLETIVADERMEAEVIVS